VGKNVGCLNVVQIAKQPNAGDNRRAIEINDESRAIASPVDPLVRRR
jgi:hypothetical protein